MKDFQNILNNRPVSKHFKKTFPAMLHFQQVEQTGVAQVYRAVLSGHGAKCGNYYNVIFN